MGGADARQQFGDVTVMLDQGGVAEVEIHRPPTNFFDADLIRDIADAYGWLGTSMSCRAIVLCSEGKHFCAGARIDPNADPEVPEGAAQALYGQAVRLFASDLPVVAAVQGAAVGGGLGLACSADFRVATPETRFSANFARLGFHHGFGLTVTLPLVAGHRHALDLLYTGRRVGGVEALDVGLCDRLAAVDDVRSSATELAREIAASAPLAVRSIRQTMRGHLAAAVAAATRREADEQAVLRATDDFREGILASAERRMPSFAGR